MIALMLAGAGDWLATFLPTDEARERFRAQWPAQRTSFARWSLFCAQAPRSAQVRVALEVGAPAADLSMYDFSKTLRLPFSVHTAPPHRITLPITLKTLGECDPAAMPTVQNLLNPSPAHARLFEEGVQELTRWLDACGYPAASAPHA